MDLELSVFQIIGLDDITAKRVILKPFVFDQSRLSTGTSIDIGKDLSKPSEGDTQNFETKYEQFDNPPLTPSINTSDIPIEDKLNNNNDEDDSTLKVTPRDNLHSRLIQQDSDVNDTTEVEVQPRLNKKKQKNKINLVKNNAVTKSVIRSLPIIFEKKFRILLRSIRQNHNKIKLFLKIKNGIKYIVLEKNKKIGLDHFLHVIFSKLNKLKNSLNDQNLSAIIHFCKKMPISVKQCFGDGIKQFIK